MNGGLKLAALVVTSRMCWLAVVGCVGQPSDFMSATVPASRPIGQNEELLTIQGWYAQVRRSDGTVDVIHSGDILGLQVGQRAKLYVTVHNTDVGWHRVGFDLCADNGVAIGLMMPQWPDNVDPIAENCIDVKNEVDTNSYYVLEASTTEEYAVGDAWAIRAGGGSLYITLFASAEGDDYDIATMAVQYDIAPNASDN